MWNEISNVLSALAFFLSIAACLFAARAAIQQPALQVRKLPLIEFRLKSAETSISELTAELEGLAQRVKMQRVRNVITHAEKASSKTDPDPYKEPDRWRDWMNSRLAKAKIGA